MSPGIIILMAVFMPIVLLLLLLTPIYIGMIVGLYIQYGDTVLEYIANPAYVINVFESLYSYWQTNQDKLDLFSFTLPVFGPFVLGVLLGLGMFFYFIRYLRRLFLMNSSEH